MSVITRRLLKELKDIEKSPSSSFTAALDPMNTQILNVALFGPPNTPYENGLFRIQVHYPLDYPWKPPRVIFLTNIYHPNVTKTNLYAPCCAEDNILKKENWSPGYTLITIMQRVEKHLIEPVILEKCSLNPEVAKVYKEDKKRFEATAREWRRKYAQE